MTKARGTFEVASWDEKTYQELAGGAKLTQASVSQTFTGDIVGEGSVRWLMAYRSDGTAHFVGLQRVEGTIADGKGSFVVETIGDFDGTVATWRARVIGGSGTGDLEGLTGSGTFGAPHGSTAEYELDYQLG